MLHVEGLVDPIQPQPTRAAWILVDSNAHRLPNHSVPLAPNFDATKRERAATAAAKPQHRAHDVRIAIMAKA